MRIRNGHDAGCPRHHPVDKGGVEHQDAQSVGTLRLIVRRQAIRHGDRLSDSGHCNSVDGRCWMMPEFPTSRTIAISSFAAAAPLLNCRHAQDTTARELESCDDTVGAIRQNGSFLAFVLNTGAPRLRRQPTETTMKLHKRILAATALTGAIASMSAFAQTKWDLASAYPRLIFTPRTTDPVCQ